MREAQVRQSARVLAASVTTVAPAPSQVWSRRLPELTFLLIVSLVCTACSGSSGTGGGGRSVPNTAQSCVTAGGLPRCYAYAYWQAGDSAGDLKYVQVMISSTALSCAQSPCTSLGEFIDDEMWLTNGQGAWVEVGYGTWTGNQGTQTAYFWADNRPQYAKQFVAHQLGQVDPSSGAATYTLQYQPSIQTQNPCANSTSTSLAGYYVTISGSGFGSSFTYDPNTNSTMRSTCNPFSPARMDAGLEAYGNSGDLAACQVTFNAFSPSAGLIGSVSQGQAYIAATPSPEVLETTFNPPTPCP